MSGIYANPSAGPSRNPSRNGVHPRPALERTGSTIMGDSSTPIATNSVVNKVASASSSLYQNCMAVLERLYRVPGFEERFVDRPDEAEGRGGGRGSGEGQISLDGNAGVASDPVSRSLHTLRLGSSLCFLFNALQLPNVQLEVNSEATMTNLKACQRGTAHFIMACKQHLNWNDEELFAIRELYGQDTNGVVKVINSVTKLLDLLEEQGVLLEKPDLPAEEPTPSGPTDDRTNVVREILDSERKYVQDLEVLQDYQRQIQANDIITQDQIHNLFLNLNSLADFQRRFLIGVEANASQPFESQRFGNLFLQMEDNFSVYEPYCANLTAAQDLAIAENAALSQLSNVLDPVSELAPLLIKPVQRLCKYPLLLGSLVKNTPDTSPHYDELKAGLESIMRVTERVNETKRKEDNRQAVVDLGSRVEDWKGHDIASFGELLLQETFYVIKNDSEREYNVYLFERIILCCKESGSSGKKSSKSNSILKKPPNKKPTNLQLKGRIFVNNVIAAVPVNRNGQCLLEVRWRGDTGEEAFTIKCRTEELLKQWQRMITKAVEDSPGRRRTQLSRRSERSMNSPMSQFPATPLSESGPSNASLYSYQSQSEYNTPYPYVSPAQPAYPPNSNGFDDEGEDGPDYSENGRTTPSSLPRRPMSKRSTSTMDRDRDSNDPNLRRPRAQTDDSSSAVINQWRSQTPANQPVLPALPRGASHVSNSSDVQSLRSSASSRQLRTKQSTEWSNPSMTSPALGYSRLPPSHDEDTTPRPNGLPRGTSYAAVPTYRPQAPPALRSRSASSPIVYQLGPNGQPQILENTLDSNWVSQAPNGLPQRPTMPPPLSTSYKSAGMHSGGTIASASSAGRDMKRFSASSNGTDRSSAASSLSAGHAGYNGSPVGPHSSGELVGPNGPSRLGRPPVPPPSAVRVKVTYAEDTFVVVVLTSVTFEELLEKVLKKIRLCGDRSKVEGQALRLRYQDEDGDKILITSQDDVAMAFDAARATQIGGQTQSLVLFASVDN